MLMSGRSGGFVRGKDLSDILALASAASLLAGPALAREMQPPMRLDTPVKLVGRPLEHPIQALTLGIRGWGRLRCIARADATLGDCQLVGEAPQGFRFGRTALAAAPQLRVALEGEALAAIVGKPTYYKITFSGDRATGDQARPSSPAVVEAAHPKGAEAVGMAELQCTPPASGKGLVSDCVATAEGPAGQGFAAAAVALAEADYRTDIEPVPQRFTFYLRRRAFSSRPNPLFAALPEVLTFSHVEWREPPRPEEGLQLPEAGVLLDCVLDADGGLSACRSDAEPATAQAALAFTPRLRLMRSVSFIVNWGQCDWPIDCAGTP